MNTGNLKIKMCWIIQTTINDTLALLQYVWLFHRGQSLRLLRHFIEYGDSIIKVLIFVYYYVCVYFVSVTLYFIIKPFVTTIGTSEWLVQKQKNVVKPIIFTNFK